MQESEPKDIGRNREDARSRAAAVSPEQGRRREAELSGEPIRKPMTSSTAGVPTCVLLVDSTVDYGVVDQLRASGSRPGVVITRVQSHLAEWMGVDGIIRVNSQHHEGIKTLSPLARPVAFTDDGLVEAFALEVERIIAVQWHPEVLWRCEEHALTLLRNFVAAVSR